MSRHVVSGYLHSLKIESVIAILMVPRGIFKVSMLMQTLTVLWRRGRSRAAATSKMEAVNYYHKALHPGCCSSRSASDGEGNHRDHLV